MDNTECPNNAVRWRRGPMRAGGGPADSACLHGRQPETAHETSAPANAIRPVPSIAAACRRPLTPNEEALTHG
jgi:hypothetical protein